MHPEKGYILLEKRISDLQSPDEILSGLFWFENQ